MQDNSESQSAFLAGAGADGETAATGERVVGDFPAAGASAVRLLPVGRTTPAQMGVEPDAPAGAPTLVEAPIRGMISVKTDLAHPDVETALLNAVGVRTPAQRKALFDGEQGVLWMAPDEVLIMTPAADVASRMQLIDETLAGVHRLILDVTDARAIFRLTGAGAREVLAKGAPIDLHPDSFRVGDLRRTRLSTVAAALYQVTAAPEIFEVICFRSYAPAMWRWLEASCAPAALPQAFMRA